jgi:hypothetical protein
MYFSKEASADSDAVKTACNPQTPMERQVCSHEALPGHSGNDVSR